MNENFLLKVKRGAGAIALTAAAFALNVAPVLAADTGFVAPGAMANSDYAGTSYVWGTPNNAIASDNTYTTSVSPDSIGTVPHYSDYLVASSFGNSLPGGATIDGIEVTVERVTNSTTVQDVTVQLMKAGSPVGSNLANTGVSWPQNSEATATYGGSSNLWGTTWSASDVNNSGFGVRFSTLRNAGAGARNMQVDAIRIKVYYTVPSDVTAPTFTVNSGTDAGPVQSDTINVTVNDANPSGSQSYGFSADSTCDGSDSFPNAFTSGADFSVAGDHTDYLCVTSTDNFANTGYQLVGQLNTDNTAPVLAMVTAVDAPTDRTPNYVFNSSEAGSISYGGSCASTTTVVSSGNNVITLGQPPSGSGNLDTGIHADCTIEVTDAAGNVSITHNINSFNTVASSGGSGGNSQPASVQVSLPNGGETFAGGTTTNIVWSSGGSQIESVRVSYSTNGGTSWTQVSNSADMGFYTWTVPTVATTAAKVKVELILTGGVVGAEDESDSAFTITAPAGAPTDSGQNTGEDKGNPLGAGGYVPAQASADSPSINVDKGLDDMDPPANPLCVSGSLIKLPSDNNPDTAIDSTVYYCGNNGKRYVFPNMNTFYTWFSDFSSVVIVDAATLAQIPLGGNVTYKPGSRMIKLTTDPKVYAVDNGGVLRHVTSEAVAVQLYGDNWASFVDDVSDAFLADYTYGDPIL